MFNIVLYFVFYVAVPASIILAIYFLIQGEFLMALAIFFGWSIVTAIAKI